jgi:hypothetical protein
MLGAAICAGAQNSPAKHNTREQVSKPPVAVKEALADDAKYFYEFKQPEFLTSHIVIEHDAAGRGQIIFERKNGVEAITEPLELSEGARTRILNLWNALRFLDSETNYQTEKQFPHMGTMRLRMTKGTRQRTAEFNWTHDPEAKALVEEYRRAANQALLVFDISVARESQPLDSPKLLGLLDKYLARNEISDPQQLVPLLRELNTDERLPLITRNHAGRILKKLEK